ncbi:MULTISPECIES: hypothetical protein [unclassified Brenneria]|uniref:hypothetical protein n=1 Tax=unclassified Brenneria TaxID=2634434 RepID=UPI0018F0B169|nr:hypothetical protein [Brenneria sp. L3-3C-1]MBJ7222386.1 hypothetical protein [Brenneria sp. L3-3C-1]MEE3643629.1 hypothetical protein [Brenneria sp. L3_3C_1]
MGTVLFEMDGASLFSLAVDRDRYSADPAIPETEFHYCVKWYYNQPGTYLISQYRKKKSEYHDDRNACHPSDAPDHSTRQRRYRRCYPLRFR